MRGLYKKVFFLLLYFLGGASSHAEILEIDSVKGLNSYLSSIQDPSTLVIFTIDRVLLIPQASYFRAPTLQKYLKIYQETVPSWTSKERDMFLIYTLIDSPQVPLSETMVKLVRSLRNKGIPVIAFTASLAGSIDRVGNILAWRLFSLEYAGYNFTNALPFFPDRIFSEDFPYYLGSYPRYEKGVLFTNSVQHSASVLAFFLDQAFNRTQGVQQPKQVIFIDSFKKTLIAVQNSLNRKFPKIHFTGIHFTAADHIDVAKITASEFTHKLEEVINYTKQNGHAH